MLTVLYCTSSSYWICVHHIPLIKGFVRQKKQNNVIMYSASCHSKPVRLNITQMKMFLMRSDIFLSLSGPFWPLWLTVILKYCTISEHLLCPFIEKKSLNYNSIIFKWLCMKEKIKPFFYKRRKTLEKKYSFWGLEVERQNKNYVRLLLLFALFF